MYNSTLAAATVNLNVALYTTGIHFLVNLTHIRIRCFHNRFINWPYNILHVLSGRLYHIFLLFRPIPQTLHVFFCRPRSAFSFLRLTSDPQQPHRHLSASTLLPHLSANQKTDTFYMARENEIDVTGPRPSAETSLHFTEVPRNISTKSEVRGNKFRISRFQ